MRRPKRADKSLGGQDKDPKRQAFQFITVDPFTRDGTEGAQLRSRVRANATKYQWRLKRLSRNLPAVQASPTASTSVDGTPVLSEDDSTGCSDSLLHEEAGHDRSSHPALEPQYDHNQSCTPFSLKRDGIAQSSHSECETGLTSSNEAPILCCCDAGRLAVSHPPLLQSLRDNIGMIMKYNVQFILPRLLPEVSPGQEHPAAAQWVELAMTSRALFHTWIHGGFIHAQAAQAVPDLRKYIEPQSDFSQAIKYLNMEMQHPNRACADENIHAVCGMMAYGSVALTHRSASSPSQGPMKSLQGLDIYSTLEIVPMHARGLAMLVALRGGLSEIKLKGLGSLISYAGISMATRSLTKPKYPFVPLVPESCNLLVKNSTQLSTSPSEAFSAYWRQSQSLLARELFSVLRMMIAHTAMISDHCDGTCLQPSLTAVADYRNHIQHSLMSLPSMTSNQAELGLHDELYEVCRLAAIIYSILVVFPLSPSTAPFEALSIQLRKQLSCVNISSGSSESQQLLLWTLFMGGISATGFAERPWFVTALTRLTRCMSLISWEEVKDSLQSFLWLTSTNDNDGKTLWVETTFEKI